MEIAPNDRRLICEALMLAAQHAQNKADSPLPFSPQSRALNAKVADEYLELRERLMQVTA